ncbi:MAG TPA: phytanoyl-CoA dioxygenase family protein [Pyrinomonadaceae bacterium]|nr:phytanoyl-CoA dioxygenase family protein [Pyrinomonadaceae bacterium]
MRKIFFNENYQETFLDKGYVEIPLLSADEIEYLLKNLYQFSSDSNFQSTGNEMCQHDWHCTFYDTNVEYRRAAMKLIEAVFEPHFEKLFVDYKTICSSFFIKQPDQGELNPHQNPLYSDDPAAFTLGIWCPLVDCSQENGTLEVVEKSQHLFSKVAYNSVKPYSVYFDEAVKNKYSKALPTKAGHAVILDNRLLHYSRPNKTETTREAIVIQLIPNECSPVLYYFDYDDPQKDISVFEITKDYFVENSPETMFVYPSELKKIKTMKSEFRFLTEDEFIQLMNLGEIKQIENGSGKFGKLIKQLSKVIGG